MSREIKSGDHVTWQTSQGKTSGKVVKKVTGKVRIQSYVANASPENPEYLVQSDRTGARAIHKPTALKKD